MALIVLTKKTFEGLFNITSYENIFPTLYISLFTYKSLEEEGTHATTYKINICLKLQEKGYYV